MNFFLIQFLHKLGKVFQASNCVNNAKKEDKKLDSINCWINSVCPLWYFFHGNTFLWGCSCSPKTLWAPSPRVKHRLYWEVCFPYNSIYLCKWLLAVDGNRQYSCSQGSLKIPSLSLAHSLEHFTVHFLLQLHFWSPLHTQTELSVVF